MDQRELKALLDEAAKPSCSWQRQNEIQCRLGEASPAMGVDGVRKIEGPVEGMQIVLDHLYTDTIQNRPDLLPALFPVFALICGDREDRTICADVDWSLV